MMDGVTILNEIEVIQVVNDIFNDTAAIIALGITILICSIAGFFIGRITGEAAEGLLLGIICGIFISTIIGAAFGLIFQHPPITETTMRYEVIVDDSVSLTEFYEHYNVIEQRGEIFIVEEKLLK